MLDGQYETAVLCSPAGVTDMALPLPWHVACSAPRNESRRRATLPWLVEAILRSAMSRAVRDCPPAVLSPSDAWPSGLGWRSHSAHTCFAGVAERKVHVAMPSHNALKLTAPANWSAAA